MMSEQYDVAIVGASLAGSSLAIGLGELGIRTVLIDRANFPRPKACGEGLSSLGLGYLHRLGLKAALEKLPHSEFHGYTVWSNNTPIDIAFASDDRSAIHSWGVERFALDHLLVGKAQEYESVNVLLGCQVREIRERPEGFLLLAKGVSIEAKYLVLADGSRSVFSTRLGFVAKYNSSRRYGFSMAFDGISNRPIDRVHMIIKDSFEAVCTPTGPNRLNVSVLADKADLASALSSDTLAMLKSEVQKKVGFSGELRAQPLSTGPIGRINRTSHRGKTILIGDCCESLDPIGGMGMTHALMSASIACEAFRRIFVNERPAQDALAWYSAQRERGVRPLRGFTRLTYMTLKCESHATLLKALSITPLLRSVSQRVNSDHSTSLMTYLSGGLLELVGSSNF